MFWADAGAEPVLLPAPGGSSYAIARSINESGKIAGWVNDTDAYGMSYAALWIKSAGGRDLTVLPMPGCQQSIALSINDAGQIVGLAVTDLGEFRAALWQPKSDGSYEMIDLSSIVPGWFFDEAFCINDAGVIAVGGFQSDDPTMTYLPGLLFPESF